MAPLSLYLYQSLKKEYEPKPTDTPTVIEKTNLLIEWFCDYDYPGYVAEAKKRFDMYKANTSSFVININLQFVMFCSGIKYGKTSDWYFLLEQYKKSTFPSERSRMLTALGCSRKSSILRKFLEMTLDPTNDIRKHDYIDIFTAVLKSNVDVAQSFFQENIEDIGKNYATWDAVPTMVKDLTDRFTTIAQIEEFRLFVENHQVDLKDAFGDLAQNGIKSAEANVKWLVTFEDELFEWLTRKLRSKSKISSSTSSSIIPTAIILVLSIKLFLYLQ